MKQFHERVLHSVLCAALITAGTFAQAQQPYPNKPIRVLVGVPPGGSTDANARMFADWLQESLKQTTILENRPGANTLLAAEAVKRAAPDGHTILVATEAFLIVPALNPQSYDPFKDFIPVGVLTALSFVVSVHPSLPINSVRDLINYAKANPGKLNWASSGNAGTSHLGIEKFKMMTGTDIIHVPYKGAGPALTDAVAGQIQLTMFTPQAISGHVQAGRLRPLAITGTKRVPGQLSNVPTFAQAGYPDYEHSAFQAAFVPAGTPAAIVERLNREIALMIDSPKVRKYIEEGRFESNLMTSQQMTEMLRRDKVQLERIIKTANIKMN